jgi:hypothetical protein
MQYYLLSYRRGGRKVKFKEAAPAIAGGWAWSYTIT